MFLQKNQVSHTKAIGVAFQRHKGVKGCHTGIKSHTRIALVRVLRNGMCYNILIRFFGNERQ
jgi:hypothetical protein